MRSFAPLGALGGFQQLSSLSRLYHRMSHIMSADEALRRQCLVIVSSPSALSSL
jgi:hypothetical protein